MRHGLIDRHSRLESPIHRLATAVKLCLSLAIVLSIVLLPRSRPILLAPIAVLLIGVALISRIPWRFLLRRLLILEPLALGVCVMTIFQPGGWRLFLILAAKCTLCLWTMLLLSNTTPFSELLHTLRRARVPALLITTMSLMYRYLFVLVDEAQRMKRARSSRTFNPERRHAWRGTATVAGQLFVRASERAERVYGSMCARGWR
jgi:cobalt/nickel transport system permease protein